eukprot:gb/GECG01014032.1/.p1 GENE.gb/GECG01014032.1/~~gb/GECG01014032.1/.p1  ORF type:complete len:288 (+),score=32.97 gb/GECG01014032.1/:1-864(+)
MRLEDFEIGRAIGKGRFGNVYLAKHIPSGGRQVALKVMMKQPIIDADCVHRLRNEVEIQSRISHPNCLRLFGYFHDENKVYLVLEYANGGSVSDHLRKLGRFSEEMAARHVASVASALAYLHERNVIHRDLKPENLLYLDDKTTPMIADFGWSIHAPPPFGRRNTFCGTVEYLPPEMLDGEAHTYSADSWALGIMAYELLFGYTPFSAPGQEKTEADSSAWQNTTIANIQECQYGYSSTVPISTDAKDFIDSMLQKNPSNRIPVESALHHPWIASFIDMQASEDQPS